MCGSRYIYIYSHIIHNATAPRGRGQIRGSSISSRNQQVAAARMAEICRQSNAKRGWGRRERKKQDMETKRARARL